MSEDIYTTAPEGHKKVQLETLHNTHAALVGGRLSMLVVLPSFIDEGAANRGLLCGHPILILGELEMAKARLLSQMLQIEMQQEALKHTLIRGPAQGNA